MKSDSSDFSFKVDAFVSWEEIFHRPEAFILSFPFHLLLSFVSVIVLPFMFWTPFHFSDQIFNRISPRKIFYNYSDSIALYSSFSNQYLLLSLCLGLHSLSRGQGSHYLEEKGREKFIPMYFSHWSTSWSSDSDCGVCGGGPHFR